ncbi:HDOD domain-containing protein [Undibacterium sp. LX40W]|uniref:HDOD domain-containing protein n=1 Tax=Undibacterium nitidum TaxID=2762298 RepID=A0A923HQD2_9BURK|nr:MULTISPECIES: HDOD domain-containing protein [Undibacterium]MBC3880552.1 HDOD domain-containing protein [Undibacterium nitidum]MBC3890712.1 HDOD domain-containing protein [Undibacterium sp. LX40W]
MAHLSLEEVTENLKDLPTLPAIVMEILNTLDNEDIDTAELAHKVTQDLALTAKTLRYANSPFYSTLIKVTTIQQAISLMGFDTVRQLVLSAALSGCFPENNCKGFDHKAFWRHSNAVAFTAKLIARRMSFNEDVAFTAGLLHDIGLLALVSLYPRQFEEVIAYRKEHLATQYEAEIKVLGVDHASVGEALAEQWHFSDVMRNTIAAHHHPDQPGRGFLASIVHVADGIAHMLSANADSGAQTISVNVVSWDSLKLDQASLDTLLEEATIRFKKLDQVDL